MVIDIMDNLTWEKFDLVCQQLAETIKQELEELQNTNKAEKKSMPENWEEEFLATRAQERHEARQAWFRQRYLEDDRYAKMMGRDNSSFFFSHNYYNAIEPAERINDKITLNAVKVLNAIEAEFMKAFEDAIPPKEPA